MSELLVIRLVREQVAEKKSDAERAKAEHCDSSFDVKKLMWVWKT